MARRPLLFGVQQKPSPSRCPDCKCTLEPPSYGRTELRHFTTRERMRVLLDQLWERRCECGVVLQWKFDETNGGKWVRRHELPLWDMDRKVIQ